MAIVPNAATNRISSVGIRPAPGEDRPDIGSLGEDCWLQLPDPPLDLNGPISVPYTPIDASWVERPIFDLVELHQSYSLALGLIPPTWLEQNCRTSVAGADP
jgi:hypothetical protein